jgi:flavin reductase (DIM6/NTAB) family NADH-FMN oxidoreductase RutF
MSTFDAAAIDEVFRAVDRPVWVVTAADGARRGGLLATWVYQCSLDPACPMLLAGLAPHHFTTEVVRARGNLAVHLLPQDAVEVALRFAKSSGRDGDKLAGLAVTTGQSGAPILADCVGWLEGTVVTEHATGDRVFFWVRVAAGRLLRREAPLTERGLFAAASPADREALKANLRTDIELLRPARDRWLEQFER